MAMTDTRPTAEATGEPTAHVEPTGLAGLIGSGDHKAVGRLFIGTSLVFGVGALVLAALARLAVVGDDGMFGAETAFRLASLSQVGLVLLAAIPLFVGIGLYVVPLQVGSSTVAFPRAAQLSYWAWLAGAVTMVGVWFADGGPAGTGETSVDLTYLSMVVVVLALLLGAVCIATTVAAMRTAGMSLDRVPMFSWSMLVATGAWLLSLPVLVANTVLVYVDTHNSGVLVGDGATAWSHLAWALVLPQVYVCAIPLLGALGDVVVTGSGARQVSRGVLMVGVGAFGALSIGGWAQFAQPDELWTNPWFVAVAVLAILPLLACLAVWATGMRGGARVSGALAVAVVGFLVLLLATVTGALFAIEQLKVQEVVDEASGLPIGLVGHANLVLGAALAGALAAIFHWGPKITGRVLNDGLGKLIAPVALLGALLWGLLPFVEGLQARFSALEDAGDALAVGSVAGAALVALALVLGIVALVGGTRGPLAEDDPWGGQTLEWATTSPPPPGNFAEPIAVRSPEPLLDPTDEPTEEAS